MSAAQPPRPIDVMVPASDNVDMADVNPMLTQYVLHMAYVHKLLFGSPLVITSGKDSIHSAGSLHGQGRAVDVRIHDLSEVDQTVFVFLLCWSAPGNKVAVFDERALGVESHIHIEYHGD